MSPPAAGAVGWGSCWAAASPARELAAPAIPPEGRPDCGGSGAGQVEAGIDAWCDLE